MKNLEILFSRSIQEQQGLADDLFTVLDMVKNDSLAIEDAMKYVYTSTQDYATACIQADRLRVAESAEIIITGEGIMDSEVDKQSIIDLPIELL